MGPSDLFPIRRKVCCGFLSPLKIHRLGRGFEPATLRSSGKHTNHYTTKATSFTWSSCRAFSSRLTGHFLSPDACVPEQLTQCGGLGHGSLPWWVSPQRAQTRLVAHLCCVRPNFWQRKQSMGLGIIYMGGQKPVRTRLWCGSARR
jgi:hypothetical protein